MDVYREQASPDIAAPPPARFDARKVWTWAGVWAVTKFLVYGFLHTGNELLGFASVLMFIATIALTAGLAIQMRRRNDAAFRMESNVS